MHYLYKKYAGVILLECSLLFDSLTIFYNVYLRLIQQYSTMIEVLVNSSERPLRKFLTLFLNLISRVGQWYSTCSVSFSSVTWAFIVISAITVVVHFKRYFMFVLFDLSTTKTWSHWSSDGYRCYNTLSKYYFSALSRTAHTFVSISICYDLNFFHPLWWLPYLQLWLAALFHKLLCVFYVSSRDVHAFISTKLLLYTYW